MHHARFALTLAVSALAISSGLTAQDEHRPPVFQDLGFDEALAQSKQEGRLLIVDAMTAWCGPCKVMDRTTWVDEELVAWIGEHALAIQLDMDVHTDVKERLAITAFPTIVAFKGGEEFDRFIGLRDAAFVGEWLSGAKLGRTGLDQAKDQLATITGDPDRVAERADLCLRIARAGAFDVVTPELLSIWREGRGADGAPYRRRDLFGAIGIAAGGDAAARATFAGVRDQLGERIEAAGTSVARAELSDWIGLNEALNEAAGTARWAVATASAEGGPELLQQFEARLFRMLVEAGEWRAAGFALGDPVRRARSMASGIAGPREAAGGMTPAIPMVPMTPRGAPEEASVESPPEDQQPDDQEPEGRPKVVPAIPMAPRPAPKSDEAAAPAAARAVRMIPMTPRGGAPTAPATPDPDQPNWDNPSDPEAKEREIRNRVRYAFRHECADRYAALLAADRIDEATALADVLLATINSPRSRAVLVARAMRAGQLDKRSDVHQRWLDEAGG